MGGATSKNVTKQTLDSMISVVTSATSESYATCSGFNLSELKGCKIDGDVNISQSNICKFDIDVFTKNASSEKVKNELENVDKQQSESVSQIIQLSSSDSSNVDDAMLNLATKIQNSAQISVTTRAINQNTFRCEDTQIGKNLYVSQKNITNTLQKLITENQSVIDAQQKLQSTIEQHSKASVSGFGFFMIFLIIALVIFAPVIMGAGVMSSFMPIFIGLGAVFGTVYTVRDCISKDEDKTVCKSPTIYYVGSLLLVLISIVFFKFFGKSKK